MKGLVSKEIIVLRCRGVKQENVARNICELSFGALARPFVSCLITQNSRVFDHTSVLLQKSCSFYYFAIIKRDGTLEVKCDRLFEKLLA